MNMTQDQRDDLARRIASARKTQFRGNRKAAYTAAGINSGTWTKAEAGEPIAERSLIAILLALWPETEGDWERMRPPLGGRADAGDLAAQVEASDLAPETKALILDALASLPTDPPSEPRQGVTGA